MLKISLPKSVVKQLSAIFKNKILMVLLGLILVISAAFLANSLSNQKNSTDTAKAGSTFIQQIPKTEATDVDSFKIATDTYFAAVDNTDATLEIFK